MLKYQPNFEFRPITWPCIQDQCSLEWLLQREARLDDVIWYDGPEARTLGQQLLPLT